MPRRDWNTPAAHSQKPRHKAMHSPARGKGGDRKLKAVKRGVTDRKVYYRRDRRPDVDVGDVAR